jgi:hypothetical protein
MTCNMGLYCSLQLSRYPAIPGEDSPTNHKRLMVCNKPYPTYGPTYPASQNGSTGTHQNLSHSTEVTPNPSYSNHPRTATQKAIEQMDARCKPLR